MHNDYAIKRRCPICGTYLKIVNPSFKEQHKVWEVCECPNCTTEVWIVPFSGMKK